jgi:parvulin-like peptidyl-prolyl isomerase
MRITIRRLGFAALAVGLAISATAAVVSYATSTHGVVARVNGEPITDRELQRALAVDPTVQRHTQEEDVRRILSMPQGARAPKAGKVPHGVERLALRKLVHARLLRQEAARRRIVVTEVELDEFTATLRQRFKDAESYAAWRKSRDLEDERALREALRTELLVARTSAAVVKDARVSDDQVGQFYEAHKAELKTPEELHLQVIAVKDQADAARLLAALKKGADFARLAQEHSTGYRAAEGGDLGWVARQNLPAGVRTAISGLKSGQVLGPIEHGADFVLLRLTDQRSARLKSLAEAKPEIEQRLVRAKQLEIFNTWLADQEKKSKIEVLL